MPNVLSGLLFPQRLQTSEDVDAVSYTAASGQQAELGARPASDNERHPLAAAPFQSPVTSTDTPSPTSERGSTISDAEQVFAQPAGLEHLSSTARGKQKASESDVSMASETDKFSERDSPMPVDMKDTSVAVAGNTATRKRERRIMPARLRRVSSLLAGTSLEDELLDPQQKLGEFSCEEALIGKSEGCSSESCAYAA